MTGLIASALTALVAIGAGPHPGFRAPTRAELAQIRLAIGGEPDICCSRATQRLVDVRISTVDPHFAGAGVLAIRHGVQIGNADVLLYRGVRWHGSVSWAVIDFGTSDTGCSFAPPAIVRSVLSIDCR